MIKIKRAYEPPRRGDGLRILIDRLWPRGISKKELKLHQWNKDLAPSTSLRTWFGHDVGRWPEFKRRYIEELKAKREALQELRALSRKHTITLVYGAKDELHNQAVVLKDVLTRTP